MARVDADRNLLLGILAQQMDFVTRDALFAAMNAWIIRKETPLGALLVERGDLAKSRRDLLEALVDEHVRAHGDDPARSLQALSSVASVAEDLGRLPDADLQASVGHLHIPETTAPSADPLETRLPESLGQPTSWNGRFRVVRPHASGGLGVVSVALDDELDREVAFKEIKDEFADHDGRRARFVLEAEITGKLEHPGIIPIYGLGHDPTGRPFYAMRFIRGDSLADAIHRYHDPNGPYVDPTRKSMQLRELLGRFLDVCNALAYAHSRGVLHRDLKPGNIMLGPFGETLVVDWGLALPLGRVPEGHESTLAAVKSTKADGGSLPSEQGQVVGTPAYMPPEQAEGAIDKLGPRSDVYGLGAILYDLLTGKHPVEGTTFEEVLRRVGKGEIKPPRLVRPEVPASLEAVCLKALALRPEDRYPSPRALAADLKAWLADEPVSARPEPFAERARRWAKRNRTAVTAAAASLLVGLVGLGSVAAVQTNARNDLAIKNVALDEQRHRAEEREAQAIAAVRKFGDVIVNEPELKNTPGLDSLRKRLLKEPMAFFRELRDRLQADHDTRPESLTLLAKANFDLGQLIEEIGDREDALLAYRESFSIWKRMAEADPKLPEFQALVATSSSKIGNLLNHSGKPADAIKSYEFALGIWTRLFQANPNTISYESYLGDTYNNIAIVMGHEGRFAEAMKAHGSSLKIRQKLADSNKADSKLQNDLASSQINIGNLLRASGEASEAMKSYESSLAIRRKLNDKAPTAIEFQQDLAMNYNNFGVMLVETGKADLAKEAFKAGLAIQQKLVEANPTVTSLQNDLALGYNNYGNILRDTGEPDLGYKAGESSLEIRQKLAREHPESPDFASTLAESLHNLAAFDLYAKRTELARTRLRQAIELQRKALASNPTNPSYLDHLAAHLENLGKAALILGDAEGANQAGRELAIIRDSDPKIVALNETLSAIIRGDRKPKDNSERLLLAQLAYDKSLYGAATRLWAEALGADSKMAEDRQIQPRYNAACAAALGGSGMGKDLPNPDDEAKAKLREQAREWLQAEQTTWSKIISSGPAAARPLVAQTLQHWREDPDLAGIRDPKSLEALPEGEREAWRTLWAAVDALLAKVQEAPAPAIPK